jgi:hypothetical protein
MGRHADDAVGLGDAGDLAGAARQGRGHQPLAHLTDLDAHKLLHAQFGGDFAGGHHRGARTLLIELAEHARHQRLHQLLESHDGRHRIPRHAEDRRAATDPTIVGLPGIMVTPCTRISPCPSMAARAKSSDPAEEPPNTITM